MYLRERVQVFLVCILRQSVIRRRNVEAEGGRQQRSGGLRATIVCACYLNYKSGRNKLYKAIGTQLIPIISSSNLPSFSESSSEVWFFPSNLCCRGLHDGFSIRVLLGRGG